MPSVYSSPSAQSQQLKALTQGTQSSAELSKEGALLEEFSSLLDQISVQLENTNEFNSYLAAPLVIEEPKVEAPVADEVSIEQPVDAPVTDEEKPETEEKEEEEPVKVQVAAEPKEPKVTIEESVVEVAVQEAVTPAEVVAVAQSAAGVQVNPEVAKELAAEQAVVVPQIEGDAKVKVEIPAEKLTTTTSQPQQQEAEVKSEIPNSGLLQAAVPQADEPIPQEIRTKIQAMIDQSPEKPEKIVSALTQLIERSNSGEEQVNLLKAFEQTMADRIADAQTATSAERFATLKAASTMTLLQFSASNRGFGEIMAGKHGGAGLLGAGQAAQQSGHHSGHNLESQSSKSESSEAGKAKGLLARHELRTLEKVENALKEVARSRDGKTLSFRLDPPQLGNVRIDVTIRDGVLHARLAAENPAVNNLLREKAHELQSLLRALGLEVDQVSVAVRDEQSRSADQEASSGDKEEKEFGEHLLNDGGSATQTTGSSGAAQTQSQLDHWVA